MQLPVQKYTDTICCPHCLRRDTSELTGMNIDKLDHYPVLIVTCRRCASNWLMYSAEK